MDDIDLADKMIGLIRRRTTPYPKCNRCGMFGVPGANGKCPFCEKGVMK